MIDPSRKMLWRRFAPLLALALAGCSKADAGAPTLASEAPAPSGAAAASASAEPDEPVPPSGPSLVDLHGNYHAPPPIPEGAPRLASIAMLTDVRAHPNPSATKVGYLRAGAVVQIEPGVRGTAGCKGGWRKIEPFGYVCIGGENGAPATATLDLEHPVVRALTRRPDASQTLPYMYGIARAGGPVYARIPDRAALKEFEPHLKQHLAKWAKDKESGATFGLDVWAKWKAEPLPPALDALADKTTDEDIPWFLKDGGVVPNLSRLVKSKDAVKIGEFAKHNGVAFVETFLYEGRRYNVSTDLRVLPADRFRPIHGSAFHGYNIGENGLDLPFALVRRKGAKQWSVEGDKLVEDGDLAWRSAVPLTGKQKMFGGKLYYETKDGHYVDDRSAGRVDPAKHMPAWGKNGEKWIDVNITKQVLVAYEGTKPVYATLVSTGEAGLGDPSKTKSTKRGIFRIHTKYVSITMDSDVVGEAFELRDVPYVQYFEDGYALHGAYWHDKFGTPKSHGCVNLAPEDARRLFYWTEPQLPPGWHGVARALTGTVVFIHP
ncbi:MAG TPA: L,D-transpeptidase [Minicystis sp.]|nr:L,D-transpeptidase [Minicystis sp.]